jgi:high-affinity iron transporter
MAAALVPLVLSGCKNSTEPVRAAFPMPPGLLASRPAREKGREIFLQYCAICHGENGDGHGPRGVGMNPPPANLTIPPWSNREAAPRIYLAIRDGVAGTAMPSWKTLGNDQIWNLVAYVHSFGSS